MRRPRSAPFALPSLALALGVLFAGCRGAQPVAPSSAPSPPPPVANSEAALFEEVAAKAGIRFVQRNGAEGGKFFFLETTPAGCALFDYNGDGWLDVFLVQSNALPEQGGEKKPALGEPPHCALYKNNGDGTFSDVTAGSGFDRDLGYGHGVAVGDYDNDGYSDVFITSYGRNYLFHNERGTGKFADVTAAMGLEKPQGTGYATSAAFGDYDNDGKLDLYLCYYCPWTAQTDKTCHDARGNRDYCSPELYDAEPDQLWRNEGNRFTDVSQRSGITAKRGRGLAVAFWDYNEDGKQDIFVANDLSGNLLWRNLGGGKFAETGAEAGVGYGPGGTLMAGMGIALADYNQSGHESLFVTNFEAMPNMLFKNDGKGLLEDVSVVSKVGQLHMPFLSFGCEFLDYDADGWADLLIANGHVQVKAKRWDSMKQRKQLLRNLGTGVFEDISDPAQLGDLGKPTVARGLAVGDYDNDGRLDALFNSQNDAAQLFRNRDRSGRHWVSFLTVGVKSNRDGLHTRFVLHAGGKKFVGTVRAGSSYLSVSDRRVYFGLGDLAKIDKVEVLWASGTRETLTNLSPDASYVITEGKGVTKTLPARKAATP